MTGRAVPQDGALDGLWGRSDKGGARLTSQARADGVLALAAVAGSGSGPGFVRIEATVPGGALRADLRFVLDVPKGLRRRGVAQAERTIDPADQVFGYILIAGEQECLGSGMRLIPLC